jgi:hypothetical protein
MNDIELKQIALNKISNYLQESGRQILDPTDGKLDDSIVFSLFEKLSIEMSHEEKLFPTTADTLMASWKLGHSSVIYDPVLDRIVSHARLAQATTHELNSQLELPYNTPKVFELGTVYTTPELRGDSLHTSTITILNLYDIFSRLHCSDHIIIGTLTNAKVAKLLSKSINFGIRTLLVNHNEHYIGALTCVCEPDQPLKGHGHHHGLHACTVRTDKGGIEIKTEDIRTEATNNHIEISEDGSLDEGACFMFIAGQDSALALFKTNILNRFGIGEGGVVLDQETTMQNFINALNSLNYYGSALTSSTEHQEA